MIGRLKKVFTIYFFCVPYDTLDKYYFGDCIVDINEEWIDPEEIANFYDNKLTAEELKNIDPVNYAIACVEYYGVHEFNGGDKTKYTKQEIMEILKIKGIELEEI